MLLDRKGSIVRDTFVVVLLYGLLLFLWKIGLSLAFRGVVCSSAVGNVGGRRKEGGRAQYVAGISERHSFTLASPTLLID